ncbi:hypothetical protein I79_014013 [Cricetulus griseus]|uniref:Uncharacterized protein n=1 Tax=Cricetulus griseus TaxID=10029 RepID=G3HT12_CRIGR|nr:hypothetical protein I79_014013 [Cricetulus griseus]
MLPDHPTALLQMMETMKWLELKASPCKYLPCNYTSTGLSASLSSIFHTERILYHEERTW